MISRTGEVRRVTVVIAQHTMRQSWIDLANTCEYRQARVLGWLATVEGRAQTLALESPRLMSPQGRGRGYTRRADRYYAQKAVGGPGRGADPEHYEAGHPGRLPLHPGTFRIQIRE